MKRFTLFVMMLATTVSMLFAQTAITVPQDCHHFTGRKNNALITQRNANFNRCFTSFINLTCSHRKGEIITTFIYHNRPK